MALIFEDSFNLKLELCHFDSLLFTFRKFQAPAEQLQKEELKLGQADEFSSTFQNKLCYNRAFLKICW